MWPLMCRSSFPLSDYNTRVTVISPEKKASSHVLPWDRDRENPDELAASHILYMAKRLTIAAGDAPLGSLLPEHQCSGAGSEGATSVHDSIAERCASAFSKGFAHVEPGFISGTEVT